MGILAEIGNKVREKTLQIDWRSLLFWVVYTYYLLCIELFLCVQVTSHSTHVEVWGKLFKVSSLLSFHYVSLKDQTQVIRFRRKCSYHWAILLALSDHFISFELCLSFLILFGFYMYAVICFIPSFFLFVSVLGNVLCVCVYKQLGLLLLYILVKIFDISV